MSKRHTSKVGKFIRGYSDVPALFTVKAALLGNTHCGIEIITCKHYYLHSRAHHRLDRLLYPASQLILKNYKSKQDETVGVIRTSLRDGYDTLTA